jgi:hypothetical protein
MKTYRGQIVSRYQSHLVVVEENGTTRKLDPRPSQKINNHSPDGFSWGYGGSGPAQLSLAILLDLYGDETIARENYQDFKWDVIANLPMDKAFELTEQQVRDSLDKLAKQEVPGK